MAAKYLILNEMPFKFALSDVLLRFFLSFSSLCFSHCNPFLSFLFTNPKNKKCERQTETKIQRLEDNKNNKKEKLKKKRKC